MPVHFFIFSFSLILQHCKYILQKFKRFQQIVASRFFATKSDNQHIFATKSDNQHIFCDKIGQSAHLCDKIGQPLCLAPRCRACLADASFVTLHCKVFAQHRMDPWITQRRALCNSACPIRARTTAAPCTRSLCAASTNQQQRRALR